MNGGQVQSLLLQLAALGVGVPVAWYLVSQARRAFVMFVVGLAFLPIWFGPTADTPLTVHLGLGLIAVAGLVLGRHPDSADIPSGKPALRIMAFDVVMAALLVIAVASYLAGLVNLGQPYLMISWSVYYAVGRLAIAKLGLRYVAKVVAVTFSGVALFALVEFATGLNLWLEYLPGSSSSFAVWGTQQFRGGVPRAEAAFGHSIALGACLAIAIVLAAHAGLKVQQRLICIAVMLAALVTTFSRTGYVIAALGLFLVLFRSRIPRGMSIGIASLFVIAVPVGLITTLTAFQTDDQAGDAASYRMWLLDLIPGLRPIGASPLMHRAADGTSSVGTFGSIDNAILLHALTNGWVPAVVLIAGLVAATIALLARPAQAPLIAIVALIPSFVTVALITQYGIMVWVVAGMAVSSVVLPDPDPTAKPPGEAGLPETSGRGVNSRIVPRISLRDVIRSWPWAVGGGLLGAIVAYALSSLVVPLYNSTAVMYYALSFGNTAGDLAQGSTYTENQMLSFARLATSQIVLEPVIEELGLSQTSRELANQISVSTPRGTMIMEITASSADPEQAARIANTVAGQQRIAVESLAPEKENGESTVSARVIQQGVPALYAFTPNTRMNVVLGGGAGALLLGGLALLIRVLDNRIKSVEDLRAAVDLPFLGSIREFDQQDRAVVVQAPTSPPAEDFRQLQANLRFAVMSRESLVLVVSSAVSGEGKSSVSLNLASVLAETGQPVLLIDGDLRRPSVAEYAGVEGAVGLTDVLVGEYTLDNAIQPFGDSGVSLLTSGPVPPNPGELLGSPAMFSLLEQASQKFQIVVVDTAPVLAVADAAILTHHSDGLVLVTRNRKTTTATLSRASSQLHSAGVTVLGMVFNADQRRRDKSLSYYEYRATSPATRRPRLRGSTNSDALPPRRAGSGASPDGDRAVSTQRN